jgi:hypothetical protein
MYFVIYYKGFVYAQETIEVGLRDNEDDNMMVGNEEDGKRMANYDRDNEMTLWDINFFWQ